MATLTVQKIAREGSVITESNATVTVGDDAVVSDDQRHAFVINNGSTGAVSATIMAQTLSAHQDGSGVLSVEDFELAIPAGSIAIMPILPNAIRANDGKANLTLDSVTDVTVAAIQLPRLD